MPGPPSPADQCSNLESFQPASLAGDPGGLLKQVRTEIPYGRRRKGTSEMATHTAEPTAGGAAVGHLTLEDRIWLLRAMLLMRGLEERAMSLYRQGKVPGSFYDGYGQEASGGARSPGSATARRLGATSTRR